MALMDLTRRLISAFAGAGGEDHGFSLMDVHWGTIFWTIVIFVTVAILLRALVWKPILKAVESRENRIRDSLDKADQAQSEAERVLAEQKELVSKHRKDSAEFLARAKDEAQQAADEILAKARKEAEEMTDRARRQIDGEKVRAIDEVRSHAVDLALQAAGHLLGKTLDEKGQKAIVQEYIAELPEKLKDKHL
jgi:F-type H+-transporting ATPase subunit b